MPDYLCYPKPVTLKDGKRVLVRLLNQGDHEGFLELVQEASEGDLCFLKQDFTDPQVIHRWLDDVRQRRVLPLAAVDLHGHRLVASANLHLGRDFLRHVGEIRLFISAPFRGLGLGSLLLQELLDLALDEDLQWLQAKVMTAHHQVIQLFRAHGFAVQTSLKDYFLRPDGVRHDVVLMMRQVLAGAA
jgi:RimJ/RimL family protein N-acetyltransferase